MVITRHSMAGTSKEGDIIKLDNSPTCFQMWESEMRS
uniref:Uncharacterized protein n=1 Tax=Arundo donax TaxID=35708 RepID=A0A0A9FS39_ARUDO